MTATTFDIVQAERPAGMFATTGAVAARTLRKFIRTPQLIVLSTMGAVMFLVINRYVFGGAIEAGEVDYVHFLVPGFITVTILFSGMTVATGVAEDVAEGFFDRLRSLPVPRAGLLAGRALADLGMMTWALAVTTAVGFVVGFRIQGSVAEALAAFALCLVFSLAFTWLFVWMGMIAGSAQAAEGMTMVVFPLAFLSSAMVPVGTMPGWLQPIARNQPITAMVNSVRSLALGDPALAGLTESTGHYVGVALLWSAAMTLVFGALAMVQYRRT